jgi:hypothetical protein
MHFGSNYKGRDLVPFLLLIIHCVGIHLNSKCDGKDPGVIELAELSLEK